MYEFCTSELQEKLRNGREKLREIDDERALTAVSNYNHYGIYINLNIIN
jgi:hypothetical protein